MNPLVATLMQLLSGSAGPEAAQGAIAAQPGGGMQLPSTAPIPQPRPAGLPNGTFTPARDDSANPLEQLLGAGGPIRAIGAGMGNLRNTGGDPFMSFGQGFGGATSYYDTQDDQKRKEELAQKGLDYKMQQDDLQNKRADEGLELRRMADERAAKTSDLQNQKSLLEIRRLSRAKGVTVDQYLRARAQAQKDADDQMVDSDERDSFIEQRTDDLLTQAGVGAGDGLTGKPGLTTDKPITATGPNGEKVTLKDGKWVPAQ